MTRHKKSIKFKDRELKILEDGLINNGIAKSEQPNKKKKWSLHDLKSIRPINAPQQTMFESYFAGNFIIANGSAGTGKTLAAIYLALCDVLSKESRQEKLIIVRNTVATRDIGYLPGTINDKLEPYEVPYMDIVSFLTGYPFSYNSMKHSGIIQFMPTSFIRGLNWDNAVVVVDEVQNLNFHEVNSVVTRLGEDSKLIIVGDQIQTDLYKSHHDKCGMARFLDIARTVKEFDEVLFTKHDIIRSQFVKSWICALEEAG